jgi:GNAT superfamily N-acetyltransferase
VSTDAGFTPSLEHLGDGHNLAHFSCGEPSLDAWLQDHGLRTSRRHISATHVWARPDKSIIAYVTLASAIAARADLPNAVGHGYPDSIPAILLARLALATEYHGQHLGGVLLSEALGIAARAAKDVAAAAAVVDALHDQAARFYEHYGFRRFPGTGDKLVIKISSIQAAGVGQG